MRVEQRRRDQADRAGVDRHDAAGTRRAARGPPGRREPRALRRAGRAGGEDHRAALLGRRRRAASAVAGRDSCVERPAAESSSASGHARRAIERVGRRSAHDVGELRRRGRAPAAARARPPRSSSGAENDVFSGSASAPSLAAATIDSTKRGSVAAQDRRAGRPGRARRPRAPRASAFVRASISRVGERAARRRSPRPGPARVIALTAKARRERRRPSGAARAPPAAGGPGAPGAACPAARAPRASRARVCERQPHRARTIVSAIGGMAGMPLTRVRYRDDDALPWRSPRRALAPCRSRCGGRCDPSLRLRERRRISDPAGAGTQRRGAERERLPAAVRAAASAS